MDSNLLSADEAATILETDVGTVVRWCEQGRFRMAQQVYFRGKEVWRIPRRDVDRFNHPRRGATRSVIVE